MDASRVKLLKAAMTQRGRGQPIEMFRGLSRYHIGCGFGDALRSIWRFVYPVLSRGAVNLLKYGGDGNKQNESVMEALKAAAKPTIGAMIKTIRQEIERRLDAAEAAAAKPATVTAPPPEPPALHLDAREVGTAPPPSASISKQSGCGRAKTTRRRRRALVHGLYKVEGKLARSVMYPKSNF